MAIIHCIRKTAAVILVINLLIVAGFIRRYWWSPYAETTAEKQPGGTSARDHIASLAKKQNILSTIASNVPWKVSQGAAQTALKVQEASVYIPHIGEDPRKNLFLNYDIHNPPKFHLSDDDNEYFKAVGNGTECLIEGTDFSASQASKQCVCRNGWWGELCSFPHALKFSNLDDFSRLKRRAKPRRLIHAHPFSIEFEMLEARFAEIGDLVDVFLIAESNYSGHGDPKPLRLLNKLREGYWSELHHKIVYVYIGYFPKAAYADGWIADDLPRHELGTTGVVKQLSNVRHDDLFVLTDTDELPQRDVYLFLKLYDGYPELFGFHLRRTMYGFYWLSGGDGGHWTTYGGGTIGVLGHVFQYKAGAMRNPDGYLPRAGSRVTSYISAGGNLRKWKLGDERYFVGWHCSWCFGIEEMRIKLVSAINADFPRWGDYPEKQNLTYIRELVATGTWFDDELKHDPLESTVDRYAPPYLLKHYERFKHILKNIYAHNR